MHYDEALAFLDGLLDRERTPGAVPVAGRTEGLDLEVMRALMHTLGDPQHAYRVVHITGTNGKGSVARMVTRLLVDHGLTVGTYSSPHLQRVNERIAWNGEPISDEDFGDLVGDVASLLPLAEVTPSWFEFLTAAALSWFSHVAVDVAVVEVGLLGRFDATNVVRADVAVVTNIGPDHTDFAPGWRTRVAEEKAGIIKPDSFLVLGETDPELLPVFDEELRAVGAVSPDGTLRRWIRGDDLDVLADRVAVGGRLVDLRLAGHDVAEVFLPVRGEHQTTNALLATAAVEALFARPIDDELLGDAFVGLRLPGRCEVVAHDPLVVLDGAHNPAGAEALAETLDDDFGAEGRRYCVFGLLAERDIDAMLDALRAETFELVVCTTAPSPRAHPARALADAVERRGGRAVVVDDVGAAISRARNEADGIDDLVVVTGSLYLVGAARTALGLPAN